MTARVLGVPKATLGIWIRASDKGDLRGAGDKPVSPEQMELARLRAELARVKMERDILKKSDGVLREGANGARLRPDAVLGAHQHSPVSMVAMHAKNRWTFLSHLHFSRSFVVE